MDVDEKCVTVSVPAAVQDASDMRVDGDFRPRTPRAVHLFSAQDVYSLAARSGQGQTTDSDSVGIGSIAIPELPPSQYPQGNSGNAAMGTGSVQSLTAGEARHRYVDEYGRIERAKLDSQMNRDKRAKRMLARRAEMLEQLQRSE